MPARSRLHPERAQQLQTPVQSTPVAVSSETKVAAKNTRLSARSRVRAPKLQTTSYFAKYLDHVPLLIISAGAFAVVAYILTSIPPESIQNSPFPFFYGPLLLAVLTATVFLGMFALLHVRRGILTGLFITFLLFLKLQSVLLTPTVLLVCAGSLLIFEIVASLVTKRNSK